MVRHPLLLLTLLGCGTTPEEAAELSAEAWVTRASLDLRGVRPTLEESRGVQEDPSTAEAVVRGFLDDPRFPGRVADLFAEFYMTRTETWPIYPQSYGLGDQIGMPAFVQSVGEEPMAFIERVAAEDLPWTELVLADWTMANGVLEQIWPVQREDGATDWRVAHYTDGRPMAGLLSSNAMWWRYGTTPSNANRGRAAQVTRLFLCRDFSEVTVPFDADLDLLDEAAVSEAIRNDQRCASCHDTLDPIAGYLYGFWTYDLASPTELSFYHPERELLYRGYSALEPALDGQSGFSLRDLGRQLASNQRYPDCAVEQGWRALLRDKPNPEQREEQLMVRNAFIEGGLTARALFGALVTSPSYRAADSSPNGRKMASPELMASQIEDLTGYRMVDEAGLDIITADLAGLRGLAGGADGVFATRNADLPNATVVLVQERLAEAAAYHVVVNDLGQPGDKRLLDRVVGDETLATDREVIVEQIVRLHARIFGTAIAPDGPEVEANLELWSALLEIDGSPAGAWFGLLSALFRDPDLLLY